MPNVFENHEFTRFDFDRSASKTFEHIGKWRKEVFKNQNTITLELACGKGEYTIQLAQRYPNKNFVGIDIKGNRIWKGAKYALAEGLDNVVFLRTRIELLELFFDRAEVNEIWITFPDPFLKKSRTGNRLTASRFLDIYSTVMAKDGVLHLKTDDPTLYAFSAETIANHDRFEIVQCHEDIYRLPLLPHPDLDIKTFYERQHLEDQKTIKYIEFVFHG